MVYPCRTVPWHAEIPLHVGVINKHLAFRVECEIVLIAIANGEYFPFFAIGIGAGDETTRGQDSTGVAIGVPLAGQQMVFAPVGGDAALAKVFGGKGVIPAGNQDLFAIG